MISISYPCTSNKILIKYRETLQIPSNPFVFLKLNHVESTILTALNVPFNGTPDTGASISAVSPSWSAALGVARSSSNS